MMTPYVYESGGWTVKMTRHYDREYDTWYTSIQVFDPNGRENLHAHWTHAKVHLPLSDKRNANVARKLIQAAQELNCVFA